MGEASGSCPLSAVNDSSAGREPSLADPPEYRHPSKDVLAYRRARTVFCRLRRGPMPSGLEQQKSGPAEEGTTQSQGIKRPSGLCHDFMQGSVLERPCPIFPSQMSLNLRDRTPSSPWIVSKMADANPQKIFSCKA